MSCERGAINIVENGATELKLSTEAKQTTTTSGVTQRDNKNSNNNDNTKRAPDAPTDGLQRAGPAPGPLAAPGPPPAAPTTEPRLVQRPWLLTTFKGKQQRADNTNDSNNNAGPHVSAPATQTKTLVPDDINQKPLIDRNSLESIHSKFSISSDTNAPSDHHSVSSLSSPAANKLPTDAPDGARLAPTPAHGHRCHSSPGLVSVATRYVSPPRVVHEWRSPGAPAPTADLVAPAAVPKKLTSEQVMKIDEHHLEWRSRGSMTTLGPAAHQKIDGCQQSLATQRSCCEPVGHRAAAGSLASQDHPDGPGLLNGAIAPANTKPTRANNLEAPFPFAGILASILGSVFFSLSVLCVKLLPDETSGAAEKTKAVFFRGLFVTLLSGATIVFQKSTFIIKRDEILVNFLRSCFGFLGVYGSYMSLKFISIGDSTALVYSSPVWTSLLSHFILKEPLQWVQLLALPASLFGILMIAHPALIINLNHAAGDIERQPILAINETVDNQYNNNTSSSSSVLATNSFVPPSLSANKSIGNSYHHHIPDANSDLDAATMASEAYDLEHRWPGIVIALCTSLLVSMVYIVLKFRKSTPIQTTTFWLGITTIVGSLTIMCFTGFGKVPATIYEWILLFGIGLCSWFGQVLLQWALSHEDASILSVVRTLDVAMTFTLSAIFLEEEILWTSVVGAAIIGLVVVSIVLNNWVQGLRRSRTDQQEGAEEMEDSSNHVAIIYQHSLTGPKGEKYPTPIGASSVA